MKTRNRLLSWLLIFAMMITTFVMPATEVKAEIIDGKYNTSDPKAFYEACEDYNDGDPLFINNNIYFATKAKNAASGVGIRWRSVGWQVTVANAAGSMTIEVDSRDGKYLDTYAADKSYSDGYQYGLFALNYDTLSTLCRNRNATLAKAIFAKSTIYITLNAIVVVNYNGTLLGDIVGEDGKGNVTPTGTLYRVANLSELNAMISKYDFSENTRNSIMNSYRNLEKAVPNNPLTIQYYADTKANAPAYSSVANGSFTGSSKPTSTVATSTAHTISATGALTGATQSLYQFETVATKTAAQLGLSKMGYYLPSGSEWKDKNGNVIAAGKTYSASQIESAVKVSASSANLYANWKPITYTIKYDGNGGSGSMSSETHTFDEAYFMPAGNTFTRRGYTFTGWR